MGKSHPLALARPHSYHLASLSPSFLPFHPHPHPRPRPFSPSLPLVLPASCHFILLTLALLLSASPPCPHPLTPNPVRSSCEAGVAGRVHLSDFVEGSRGIRVGEGCRLLMVAATSSLFASKEIGVVIEQYCVV